MAVCPSVPVDVSRSLLRGVSVVVCVSFVCLFVSVLLPGDCVSVWVCLFISVSGSLVPSPRASGGRAPLPELSPVRARGRVPAVGCWAPTEAREPAGRGDVPSPRPSPRPRSLCRPLPPRRDRGGLCRWRSAASRHLLPLGRCLLRGPDRSLARSASLGPRQRRPGRGLGCVRLGSAGLGRARPGSAGSKNSEEPRLLRDRQPAVCERRSHPYAAAVIQLAGLSKLPCHWSYAGLWIGPPLVQEEEAAAS